MSLPLTVSECLNSGFFLSERDSFSSQNTTFKLPVFFHEKFHNKIITGIAGIVNLALIPVIAAVKLVAFVVLLFAAPILILCIPQKELQESKLRVIRNWELILIGGFARSLVDITVIGALITYGVEMRKESSNQISSYNETSSCESL